MDGLAIVNRKFDIFHHKLFCIEKSPCTIRGAGGLPYIFSILYKQDIMPDAHSETDDSSHPAPAYRLRIAPS